MRRLAAIPTMALAVAFASAAQAQDSSSCRADLERLGDWGGVWIAEDLYADINGREPEGGFPMIGAMKLAALAAPLNDLGWNRIGGRIATGISGGAKIAGWSYPLMMSAPAPFKFIISPDETAIISQYRDIRYVYTDGSGHEPEDERWATPWGDSVGCWEDGTLQIETVGVRYAPGYNYLAPPLSENARFVERMRMAAPGRIESEITVTDPETLDQPWVTRMVYLRHPVLKRLVHDGDTFDNDRLVPDGDHSLTIAEVGVPEPEGLTAPSSALRLSIAELDRLVGRYAFDGAPLTLIIERRNERLYSRVDPVLPIPLPIRAQDDALTFFSPVDGARFRFTADGSGQVIEFEAIVPDGTRATGKRIP